MLRSDGSKIVAKALNVCMQTRIISLDFFFIWEFSIFIICVPDGRIRCATTCHENSKWREQSNVLLRANTVILN